MKHLNYLVLSLLICIIAISCDKTELIETNSAVTFSAQERISTDQNAAIAAADNYADYQQWAEEAKNFSSTTKLKEYQAPASCSSSNILFAVKGAQGPATLRVFDPVTNQTTYYPMGAMTPGSNIQVVTVDLPRQGNWRYAYVNSSNYSPLPGANVYYLRNTPVNVNINHVSSLYWPFGNDVDNSSWGEPYRWTNNYVQANGYVKFDARVQRWNWGKGHAAVNTPVTSPVEGRVVFAGNLPTYGNTVDVLFFSNGKRLIFRVAHLNQIEVAEQAVVSRNSVLGMLGTTGNALSVRNPHAYCVLYQVDEFNDIIRGLRYEFDAACR